MKPNNNEPKFRASYSVISLWASGNWEMAVGQYFKLRKFTTEEMADGKDHHEKWCAETLETGKLPAVFGAKQLINPKCEIKKVIELAPWLDVVGVIDCLDEPIIYEYKTGIQSSETYASGIQLGVYGVLATYDGKRTLADGTVEDMPGVFVDRGEIHHYNQYSKKTDCSFVWITDKMLEDTYNWLITFSSEMHNYLIENDLYAKLGGESK